MNKIFLFIIMAVIMTACSSTKKPTTMPDLSTLNGAWELNYITGPRIAFDGLYPRKKPMLNFDVAAASVSGNTSCNNFNGKLNAEGSRISFNEPMAITKMACIDGNGETVFLETLKKVTNWSVTDGNTLNLIAGDIAVMRFSKK